MVRNTLLQLTSQIAGLVFTGGLTLYLVRALGASGYGVYALAVSIGGLILTRRGWGCPGQWDASWPTIARTSISYGRSCWSGSRFRRCLDPGQRGLFGLAGPIADCVRQFAARLAVALGGAVNRRPGHVRLSHLSGDLGSPGFERLVDGDHRKRGRDRHQRRSGPGRRGGGRRRVRQGGRLWPGRRSRAVPDRPSGGGFRPGLRRRWRWGRARSCATRGRC